jgi:hypothetical protein
MTQPIESLRDRHIGQTAWVVGKGPSLVYLRQEDIGPGPVIALNQAIVWVEGVINQNEIYSMQKDGCGNIYKGHVCNADSAMVRPKNAVLLIHEKESPFCFIDYSPRYSFDCEKDFGIPWNINSAAVAIFIGGLMGCRRFVFVSLDACVNGSCENVLGEHDKSYAVMALFQKKIIESSKLNAEFLTPCA